MVHFIYVHANILAFHCCIDGGLEYFHNGLCCFKLVCGVVYLLYHHMLTVIWISSFLFFIFIHLFIFIIIAKEYLFNHTKIKEKKKRKKDVDAIIHMVRLLCDLCVAL